MTTISLPRLTARNAVEARAQLAQRREILLQAAADLLDRAELFTDVPEVCDDPIAEARALFDQAQKCG